MNIICQSLYYQYILDKFHFLNNNNNIVLSMLYAEICPKVRRHNARPKACYMPKYVPRSLGTYFGI